METAEQVSAQLQQSLHFERLLLDISRTFINTPAHRVDGEIQSGLRAVVEFLGVDRGNVWELDEANGFARVTHSHVIFEIASVAGQCFSLCEYRWSMDRILRNEIVRIDDCADLPDEALPEKTLMEAHGARSTLLIPLFIDGRVRGMLNIGALRQSRIWSEDIVQRLYLLGQIFASALERKWLDEKLREDRQTLQTIVDSLPGLFFILDHQGRCLRWNRGATTILGCGARELRRRPALHWVAWEDRARARAAFAQALAGRRMNCELRIRCKAGGKRFFHAEAVAATIDRQDVLVGLAVDISQQKQTERAMQQQRSQLAYMQRLGVLGELTAALAHELNQPLTAILNNAQAAQRFLQADEPDLREIQEILGDIVADDKRAGAVIQGLRRFLRREDTDRQPLDINQTICEVLDLLHSDLVIRRTTLIRELAPELPAVVANRVQLQQVMFNLIINAAEAMQNLPPEQRRISVTTTLDQDAIGVAVEDCGCGIDADALASIFQALFTTKPTGMGMGLAVSRSIVEAHGGRLQAYNNPGCGATFRFTLPTHLADGG